MPTAVSDARSNANDQIAHAARAIGRSENRRAVFAYVSSGKRKVKSVIEIAEATGMTEKQVLMAGKALVANQILGQTKERGRVAYEKDTFYSQHKRAILKYAANPQNLAKLPTKTNPQARANGAATVNVKVVSKAFDIRRVTVEDIAPKTAAVEARSVSHVKMPERDFKEGLNLVIDEPRQFKDWGGEKNDVFTTQMKVKSTRRTAAIAFKGPGQRGRLTPAKLGKNGDQIQRLFETGSADVFIQQFWADVEQSVHDLIHTQALAESVKRGGKTVWYGVLDGIDSARMIAAYPDAFPKEKK